MAMGRPDCWSRLIEFWKFRALEGVTRMVDLAP